MAAEIEVAAEGAGLGQLRRPVDAPLRRGVVLAFRAVEPLAEQRVELMAAVGRLERFAIEAAAVHRRADQHGVQPSVARAEVRPERVVAVPEAEVARVAQRLLPLAAPRDERLDLRMQPQRAVDLHAAPPVVVAEAAARADRREARFERRQLPLVVAGGQIVQLAADVQLRLAEQRPLEPERVAGALRRDLVRQVAGDEGVVEAIVIEHRDPHAERRHEAVDRREPVLALAEIGHDLEPARRLAQADEQDPLAVAVDQVEGASPAASVAAVGEGLRIRPAGADRAARLPQQHVERLPGAPGC